MLIKPFSVITNTVASERPPLAAARSPQSMRARHRRWRGYISLCGRSRRKRTPATVVKGPTAPSAPLSTVMSDDAAAPVATPAKKGRKPKEGSAKKKASKPTHPPTLEMITKAISHEKDPKGVSVMAIKKYILAQYKVQPVMLRHMLRRAFDAGLAAGKLTRPKGQSDSSLLSGRYRLAGKEPKAKKAAAPKPKKAAKSPAKKPAAKKPKAKTPKKKPAAAAAKKAKSPKKVKKTPKKPAAKKAPAKKKTPKKAAKKA